MLGWRQNASLVTVSRRHLTSGRLLSHCGKCSLAAHIHGLACLETRSVCLSVCLCVCACVLMWLSWSMLGVLFSCVRSCRVLLVSTLYCVHCRLTHFLHTRRCVVTVRHMTASQAYCKRLFSICGEMTVGKQNRMNCKQQNSSSSYQTQSRCASVGLYQTPSHCKSVGQIQSRCEYVGQTPSHCESVALYHIPSHCESVGQTPSHCESVGLYDLLVFIRLNHTMNLLLFITLNHTVSLLVFIRLNHTVSMLVRLNHTVSLLVFIRFDHTVSLLV